MHEKYECTYILAFKFKHVNRFFSNKAEFGMNNA